MKLNSITNVFWHLGCHFELERRLVNYYIFVDMQINSRKIPLVKMPKGKKSVLINFK